MRVDVVFCFAHTSISSAYNLLGTSGMLEKHV